MAKATKTWKLGEVAQGGVITVEITGKIVTVIGKEWDFSTGSRKSSDQSNATEFIRGVANIEDSNAYRNTLDFLSDLVHSYYADQIMKWIESKVKFKKDLNWW